MTHDLTQNLAQDNHPNCENGIGQFFMSDLHLNFRLRENKNPELPSAVYATFIWQGVRHRVNTGYKVMSAQWNAKSQRADVGSAYSTLENKNNSMLNEKLSQIHLGISDFFIYFCKEPSEMDVIPHKLRKIVNPKKIIKMGNRKQQKLAEEQNVIDIFKEYVNSLQVKESSKDTYITHINVLKSFLKQKGLPIDVETICSAKTWHDFKSFLLDASITQGTAASVFNMLRKWLAEISPIYKWDMDVHILTMKMKGKANHRNYVIVTDEEIDSLLNLSDESLRSEVHTDKQFETLKRHRMFFGLQCLTGCRVSDLNKILANEGDVDEEGKPYIVADGDQRWFSFIPKKTDEWEEEVRCNIPFSLDERILPLYQAQKGTLPQEMSHYEQRIYNDNIKIICKLAGMTQPTKKSVASKGKRKKTKIDTRRCDMVSSHDARHSFITNLVNKGKFTMQDITAFTGHTSIQYIQKVYANLTDADVRKSISNKMKSVDELDEKTPSSKFVSLPKDIEEAHAVLCFLGVDYDEYCEADFETLLRMVAVKEHEILTKCDADGIQLDLSKIKETFNDKAPLKARKNALRVLREAVKGK